MWRNGGRRTQACRPRTAQLAGTGAVGALHAWWPLNPGRARPWPDNDVKGDFQYAVGAGDSYTLTVRQQPIAPFSEYYTPQ